MMGLMNMGMGIHVYVKSAQTWTYGCMGSSSSGKIKHMHKYNEPSWHMSKIISINRREH